MCELIKTDALPQKVKQLKNFTFVIIDDNPKNRLKTKATAESFQNLNFFYTFSVKPSQLLQLFLKYQITREYLKYNK